MSRPRGKNGITEVKIRLNHNRIQQLELLEWLEGQRDANGYATLSATVSEILTRICYSNSAPGENMNLKKDLEKRQAEASASAGKKAKKPTPEQGVQDMQDQSMPGQNQMQDQNMNTAPMDQGQNQNQIPVQDQSIQNNMPIQNTPPNQPIPNNMPNQGQDQQYQQNTGMGGNQGGGQPMQNQFNGPQSMQGGAPAQDNPDAMAAAAVDWSNPDQFNGGNNNGNLG